MRREFDYTCAYCGVFESENGSASNFEIDHYAPKKKFPQLSSNYSNLFYSCGICNRLKGDYWPAEVDVQQGAVILNPVDFDLDDHFDKESSEWLLLSSEARWN